MKNSRKNSLAPRGTLEFAYRFSNSVCQKIPFPLAARLPQLPCKFTTGLGLNAALLFPSNSYEETEICVGGNVGKANQRPRPTGIKDNDVHPGALSTSHLIYTNTFHSFIFPPYFIFLVYFSLAYFLFDERKKKICESKILQKKIRSFGKKNLHFLLQTVYPTSLKSAKPNALSQISSRSLGRRS